ncbi:hypothetical protein [Lactobacillus sp.]|uniref:hypothetical protein n=1 Tax=Lactobacillus sp. TaxID=1591 RepID=UPI00199C0348|nr:hypothetical protein [Lactobacillus sp.]MBD5430716.1 hypothetical protein [Lactobacillus sp.]
MGGKEKALVSWLIVAGICALLAGLYVNLSVAHYQTKVSWTKDAIIAAGWAIIAIISGWQIYRISYKNYVKIKQK